MAIINSIVMGKSRGKIGNVVTTTLKGQVIAKARNFAPANPQSDLQTFSRNRMSNAVMAWQFLSVFLANTSAMAKSTESTYNAFIRLTKNFFSENLASSRPVAAGMLATHSWGLADIASVTDITLNVSLCTVSFVTSGAPWSESLVLQLFGYDGDSGRSITEIKNITQNEWNNGTVVGAENYASMTDFVAYVFDSATKKTSNVIATQG